MHFLSRWRSALYYYTRPKSLQHCACKELAGGFSRLSRTIRLINYTDISFLAAVYHCSTAAALFPNLAPPHGAVMHIHVGVCSLILSCSSLFRVAIHLAQSDSSWLGWYHTLFTFEFFGSTRRVPIFDTYNRKRFIYTNWQETERTFEIRILAGGNRREKIRSYIKQPLSIQRYNMGKHRESKVSFFATVHMWATVHIKR